MQHSLHRPWDSFDAYLFDIDGTLLHCADATHYFAFSQALKMLAGRELTIEGVTAHGNTDVGILRDALALAAIPEESWRPHVAAACTLMGDFVTRRKSELSITVLPNVSDVLDHLRAKGARLGVATGNLERIGRLKLEQAGLLEYFSLHGWSDAFEFRSDVFGAAVAAARASCGPDASLCFLGDTPADIRAAQDHHVPVIAVATGIYPYERLMQEQPEMCLRSFEELGLQKEPAKSGTPR